MMHPRSRPLLFALLVAVFVAPAVGQGRASDEAIYYAMETVPIPEGTPLEVGGMAFLPSGDLAVSTRRGDIWIIENPDGWYESKPHLRRFARGLHEPLGLAWRNGSLYTAQRGELTRLADEDGDGGADVFETVFPFPVSGNYHEYAFGPVVKEDGSMIVSLNLGTEGPMVSLVPWRGWILEITPDGEMTPMATGMRSPAGLLLTRSGDLFYSDNQGDWIGSGWVTHVERGDFTGNPEGLTWTHLPGSPLTLKREDVPDTGEPMHIVAMRLPALKPPAVWFPHAIMGISTSGMIEDTMSGAFGPFEGQIFVGDQGHSKIMRMALEEVDGVYQGAVFDFREGFASGVLRMVWSEDAAMYVGQTARGWEATGGEPFALQRLRWTGQMPFEMHHISARPDGFELVFTQPIDNTGSDPGAYQITSFTYKYHSAYGSPVIEQMKHDVRGVDVSDDGLRARIAVDGLRQGYIYEVKAAGVRSSEDNPLFHPVGYYTLNRIPEGERMQIAAVSSASSPVASSETNEGGGGAGERPASVVEPEWGKDAEANERASDDLPQPKRQTSMPDQWDRPDVTINVGTQPGLKFDLEAFSVPAGGRVELIFNNTDDMLHNLVIVVPGSVEEVALAAMNLGLEGPEKHYVPEDPAVLYHTALLQPGASESIYFTAPASPGTYTFVCTFPGHAFTMRGTMTVTG